MGTFYNSIDSKNRMIVPSKHREQLDGRCVLTKALDKCLNIYSIEDWQNQMDKMSRLPESDPKVRGFIRHFCANAVECEFDKQGRIVIPATLKEYAGIEKELVTMGVMSRIEVWGKEVWESPENDNRMDAEEFAETLAHYNF